MKLVSQGRLKNGQILYPEFHQDAEEFNASRISLLQLTSTCDTRKISHCLNEIKCSKVPYDQLIIRVFSELIALKAPSATAETNTAPLQGSSIPQAHQEIDRVVAKLKREDSPFTYLPISNGKDCLYNAVIKIEKVILKEKALFGDVETLRSFLADHVTLNSDRYKYSLKDYSNEAFGAYVKGIRDGEEPGNIEISALMYLLSRTIVIVQSDGNTLYWDKVDLFDQRKPIRRKPEPIFVFYNQTEKHYDALILKKGFDARKIAESMPAFFTIEALEEPKKMPSDEPQQQSPAQRWTGVETNTATLQGSFFPQAPKQGKAGQKIGFAASRPAFG